MTGFKIRTRDASINYGPMPDIDAKRFIAVYIRQSRKDADDKNGESRKTQLELKNYAATLSGEKGAGVREYDEKSGKSGQKRIDQREKLNQLYKDMEAGLISAVIVSREDRLFRDKWGTQSGTFMELAEKRKVLVIVPPLSINGKPRFYNFSNYEHVKAFKDKMQAAYDYIETHIKYMNMNQRNKGARGNFDGRWLPPGFMIPYGQEKMEQKIGVYEPWAKIIEELYSTWEAYDYSIPKLARYIETMPYLFPDIPEEDTKKYLFRTSIDRVSGGFKPKTAITLKSWFTNVAYIGWWLISQESGEVIADNHPAIIDRERFEKGYIQLTGHTLEGIPVNLTYPPKRHQARRDRDTSPEAVLEFVLSSPAAPWISVCTVLNRYKNEVREELYYKGYKKSEGEIYNKNIFCIHCEALDTIVINRLEALAEFDKQLALRIERSLEEVRQQQVKECVSIEGQLKTIKADIKTLTGRLTLISELTKDETEKDKTEDEDNPVTALYNRIQELRGQKRELEEKRKRLNVLEGQEEVRQFYTVLGNIKEEWPKCTIEQKQKLIKLLTTKVELTPCSMHWYKLAIHWIGPVCNRPDVAYIWRMRPEAQTALEAWELDLIREHYPTCSMEYLLEKIPNRTWATIITNASSIGVQREESGRGKGKRAIPAHVSWEDIIFFPDKEKAIAMAREAIEDCKKHKAPFAAKWLIPLRPESLVESGQGNNIIHDIDEKTASAVCRYE
jgi:hypothetical protein